MAIDAQKNNFSSTAIWSITPNGKRLGQMIQKVIKGSVFFVSANVWGDPPHGKNIYTFEKLSKEIHHRFEKFTGHVFIFSTGIAVRILAPLLKSKTIDPGVVVVDDNGNHVIALLSGHIGGANQLAEKIAAAIQATPVITTATDTNHLPSIDLIAKDQGLYIETPQNIKVINMAFLTGDPIKLYDPFSIIKNNLPNFFWTAASHGDLLKKGLLCSHEAMDVPRETMILRPPVLSVGIGCNRGTSVREIKQFLFSVLKKKGLSPHSICRFATSDIKKDESGLLALSKQMKIQINFYSKKELNSVKTIKTPSKMVEKHLGVRSVCEAGAILAAGNGNLIVSKKKNKDVTIAVAIKK